MTPVQVKGKKMVDSKTEAQFCFLMVDKTKCIINTCPKQRRCIEDIMQISTLVCWIIIPNKDNKKKFLASASKPDKCKKIPAIVVQNFFFFLEKKYFYLPIQFSSFICLALFSKIRRFVWICIFLLSYNTLCRFVENGFSTFHLSWRAAYAG